MRKFTSLSVFAAGVALLFISGSFFPCLAVDACYKTRDGRDFHVLVKPGEQCKKDETRISLDGGAQPTFIIYEADANNLGCDPDAGDLYLSSGGAWCNTGVLDASYAWMYSSDPTPMGWSATCDNYSVPHIVIYCVR